MVPSIAMYHKQFNWTTVTCLHTVQWSNSSISNNSIQRKSTKFNGSKYCYASQTIQLNNSHLFTHSSMIKQFYFEQFNLAFREKMYVFVGASCVHVYVNAFEKCMCICVCVWASGYWCVYVNTWICLCVCVCVCVY